MKKRILCLLLAISMILSAVPVTAGAAADQKVTANAVSVTAGNLVSVTLKAENFQNIAALDVDVFYDASVLTVSSTSNGSVLSGAQASVNTAEAGVIKLSAMALNGMNGTGNLLTINFRTVASCTPGTYPITVTIGRAYDGNLSPATIGSSNGSVTINKPTETETFSLSRTVNKTTLQKGDVVTFEVKNNGNRSFVSGEFTLEYNYELFAFESATLGSGLMGESALYSINSATLGQVRIAYANQKPVNSTSLFTVSLQVIADTNTTATVTAKAANVYRENLSAYLPGSTSYSFTLKETPEEVDYPDAFLRTEELVVGRQNQSVFCLEAGAGVAAADFTISYDTTVLRCVSVSAAVGVAEKGGMLVINDRFDSGAIRFSYVNMDAYDAEELPLVVITWEPLQSPSTHYQVNISGVGVVDTQQNAVKLEYVPQTGCILVREVVPPVCLADGYTSYTCACGEGYHVDVVPMLGHDLTHVKAQVETCTQIGWQAYEYCNRCDYTTYDEIAALGHDEVYHEARSATCLSIGWDAYVTCRRCDYTTYQEITALGHDEVFHDAVAPTCTQVGWHAYNTCSRCDYTTYVEIPALGHDEITHEAQVVTCTEIGWNTYVTCTRCDYTTYDEIAALGHDEIYHEARSATCLSIGWDAYVTCRRCDYTGYVEIPALGHDYIDHAEQAATCTGIGWDAYQTCSRCDYTTYVEIPALNHDYIDHVAQAATCTDIGWDAYQTCSRCDYTTYVEIPATGHNFVQTVCSACGVKQTPLMTWDISADGSGSLMADLYTNYVNGGYELVITGSGAMASYSSYGATAPWNSYRDNITRVEMSEGITSIGAYAFYYCQALRQISVPDSVERIENYAVSYCENLVVIMEGAALPADLGSYWNNYSGPYYLAPQKVIEEANATYVIDRDGKAWLAKYIGGSADIAFKESIDGVPVTGISRYAFYNKGNLGIYRIPEQIQYIDAGAFYGCSGTVLIVAHATLPTGFASGWYSSCKYYLAPMRVWEENGFLFLLDQQEKLHLIRYQGSEKEVIVPGYVNGYPLEDIASYAFSKTVVEKVVLPDGLRAVSEYMFDGCTKLREVVLPEGLLTIDQYAFRNCTSLQQIQLPQSLTSIGLYAFWDCAALKTAVIPDKITTLNGTFVNCYALESVTLPDGITQLGSMVFYGCRSLKDLRLPKNLKSIGSNAFYNCNMLRILEIPAQVHSVNWNSSFSSTTLDTLYIQSPQLAASITSSVASYQVFKNLKTLVVPAGTGTEYVQGQYPYCETIQRDGVAYDCYSLHAHDWQQTVISEYVACRQDGVIQMACGDCGVEVTQITKCHDEVSHEAKVSTCTEVGWTAYTGCSRCDYVAGYVEFPALGHDYIDHVAQVATCTGIGWDAYQTCGRCDYTTYDEIAALGHDEIHHEAKEPTCTETGWDAYVTCSRCDYTTYAELPTLDPADCTHYTVIFANDDGTTISVEEYHLGETIVVPDAPTKTGSNGYTYTFTGWDKAVETVCAGDATYVATYSEPVNPLAFAGASVTLYHNLAVNFRVNKAVIEDYGFTDFYAVFEINGVRTVVEDYTLSGTRYVFACSNIAPNQMNDTIYATLYATLDGKLYSSEVAQYSVADYCYRMLTQYPGDAYAELRTLLVDLLHYGAAAQVYTGYKTGNLADADLTATQLAWGTSVKPQLTSIQDIAYKTVSDPKATWKGAGLYLQDAVTVRFRLAAQDINGLSVKIESDVGTWIIPASEFVPAGTDTYYVYFNGLNAGQMRQRMEVTVCQGNKPVSNTVVYSIESYAYAYQDSTAAGLSNLLDAMMKYGDAAYAYAN